MPSSFLGGVIAFFPAALLLVAAAGIILLWVYSPAKLPYAGWTLLLLGVGAAAFSFFGGGGGGGLPASNSPTFGKTLPVYLESRALVAVAVAVLLLSALYQLGTSTAAASLATSYVGIVVGVLGLLVLLALGWLQFSQQLQQTTGVAGLLVHLLFALPCYLAMLAQYLADDFKNTAPATLLLLATEAVLLVLYRYRQPIASAARRLWSTVSGANGANTITTPLQKDKVFLNYETRLGNRPLPEGLDASGTGNRTHTMLTPARTLGANQDYRVTLELYLHPIELGGDAAPLAVMRYADGGATNGRGGCPSLYFEGAGVPRRAAVDNQRNRAQLQVYVTNRGNDNGNDDDKDAAALLLPVPMQKWVALAFYYTRTQVDVFLDDALVHSRVWTPENRPVFGPGDKFVLGHPMPNGGALGSLRNLAVTTPKPVS